MGARAIQVTRTVTPEECPWLRETIEEGEVLYICTQATYGCVSPGGGAITRDEDGGYPFFELPNDSFRRMVD